MNAPYPYAAELNIEYLKHPHVLRFQVLTAARMKFIIFWDVLPCS
jgi:hypothetical protein